MTQVTSATMAPTTAMPDQLFMQFGRQLLSFCFSVLVSSSCAAAGCATTDGATGGGAIITGANMRSAREVGLGAGAGRATSGGGGGTAGGGTTVDTEGGDDLHRGTVFISPSGTSVLLWYTWPCKV